MVSPRPNWDPWVSSSYGAPGDGAPVFLEGHHVGHELAGMGGVGEPVDHRHRGVRRQFIQLFGGVRADGDDIDEARQHPCRVGDGLTDAQVAFAAADDHHVAPQLPHAHLEGDPGAGRGLLEDQGQGLAGHRLVDKQRFFRLRLQL